MLLPSIPTVPASGPAATDPLLEGLVDWWDFNEQSGSSVGRVNGLIAAPLPGSSVPSLGGGSPFRVPGADGWGRELVSSRGQCFVVPDNSLLRIQTDGSKLLTQGFTVAGRDSLTTFVASRGLASKANTGANNVEWFVTQQTSTQIRARLNTVASDGTTSSPLTLDSPAGEPITLGSFFNWRFWLDIDAQTVNLQVDGGTIVSAALGTRKFNPTNPSLQFGRYSNLLDGVIDWRAYANRVWTTEEWARIRTGGDSGRPLSYPFSTLRALTIVSPVAYQTLQRNAWTAGQGTATFLVEGEYRGAAGSGLEVRLAGSEWQAATGTIESGRFSVSVTFPVCQGALSVRWADATGVVATVANVGVGDVVGVDGQSGADGRGLNSQPVTDTTSGFTPTMFDQDGAFRVLADPVNSATARGTSAWLAINDSAAAGSWIPALVSAWQIDRQCPVMVVSSPLGSTSIEQHLPNAGDHYLTTTLYGCHNSRCRIAGGVGFNLVQIGEQNALDQSTAETMQTGVTDYADAFFADRGAQSWFSLLQTSSGIPEVDAQEIRDGILAAVAEDGNVRLGPDFKPYTTDDAYHLRDDADMTLQGQMWFAAVKADRGA